MNNDFERVVKATWNLFVRMFLATGTVVFALFSVAWTESPIKLSLELVNEPSLLRACACAAICAFFASGLATHGGVPPEKNDVDAPD